MENPCFCQLEKIEFVVTDTCTGRCKHCSWGDHVSQNERLDPKIAADAVRKIASRYPIGTVMAFGGEPLLHIEAVEEIMRAANDLSVERRQVITSGYFAKDAAQMRDTVRRLYYCGVNDLLLSVDAFHQETIPLATVREFARAAKEIGIPIRLQPAWLVSRDDPNPYNARTREILSALSDLDIPVGDGNVVLFEGNARKYLSKYFTDEMPENPYTEDPCNVKCVSFSANGDVFGGNIYEKDIMEILEEYSPTSCK